MKFFTKYLLVVALSFTAPFLSGMDSLAPKPGSSRLRYPNTPQSSTTKQTILPGNYPLTFKSPYNGMGVRQSNCSSCNDRLASNRSIKLRCGHILCLGCANMGLNAYLRSRDANPLKCKQEGCDRTFTQSDVNRIVDAAIKIKFPNPAAHPEVIAREKTKKNLYAKIIAAQSSKKPLNAQIGKGKAIHEVYSCNCKTKPQNRVITLSCSHSHKVCMDCFSWQLKKAIEWGHTDPLICKSTVCAKHYSEQDVRAYIDKRIDILMKEPINIEPINIDDIQNEHKTFNKYLVLIGKATPQPRHVPKSRVSDVNPARIQESLGFSDNNKAPAPPISNARLVQANNREGQARQTQPLNVAEPSSSRSRPRSAAAKASKPTASGLKNSLSRNSQVRKKPALFQCLDCKCKKARNLTMTLHCRHKVCLDCFLGQLDHAISVDNGEDLYCRECGAPYSERDGKWFTCKRNSERLANLKNCPQVCERAKAEELTRLKCYLILIDGKLSPQVSQSNVGIANGHAQKISLPKFVKPSISNARVVQANNREGQARQTQPLNVAEPSSSRLRPNNLHPSQNSLGISPSPSGHHQANRSPETKNVVYAAAILAVAERASDMMCPHCEDKGQVVYLLHSKALLYCKACQSEYHEEEGKLELQKKKCQICLDDKSSRAFINLQCGHTVYCYDCLYYLLRQAKNTKSNKAVKCPDTGCAKPLTPQDVRSIISVKHAISSSVDEPSGNLAIVSMNGTQEAFFDNALFENLAKDPTSRHCPTADCPYVFINDEGIKQIITCQGCKKKYCSNCLINHSNLITCDQAKENHLDSQGDTEAKSQQWMGKNTKNCPGCSVPIQKNEGCNHMTCKSCSYEFCWQCCINWKTNPHDGYYNCPSVQQVEQRDDVDYAPLVPAQVVAIALALDQLEEPVNEAQEDQAAQNQQNRPRRGVIGRVSNFLFGNEEE